MTIHRLSLREWSWNWSCRPERKRRALPSHIFQKGAKRFFRRTNACVLFLPLFSSVPILYVCENFVPKYEKFRIGLTCDTYTFILLRLHNVVCLPLYYTVLHHISLQNARLVEDGAKLQTTLSRLREASATQACTHCMVRVCLGSPVCWILCPLVYYVWWVCCLVQCIADKGFHVS